MKNEIYLHKNSSVLKRPHVSEKAFSGTENEDGRSYVFLVETWATKPLVREAVKSIYGVTPLRINITKLPAKTLRVRGKEGHRSSKKKAVVYLKVGDKIDIA